MYAEILIGYKVTDLITIIRRTECVRLYNRFTGALEPQKTAKTIIEITSFDEKHRTSIDLEEGEEEWKLYDSEDEITEILMHIIRHDPVYNNTLYDFEILNNGCMDEDSVLAISVACADHEETITNIDLMELQAIRACMERDKIFEKLKVAPKIFLNFRQD